MINKILTTIYRGRNLLIALAILGLFGYTGYQISRLATITPDQAYIEAKKESGGITKARINTKVIEALDSLENVPATNSFQTGKTDPFNS